MTKEKKELRKYLIATLLGVAVLTTTYFVRNEFSFNARGENTTYTIQFSDLKNKIATGTYNPSGYDGTGTVTTELGNNLNFDFVGLRNDATIWQTINANGYITNKTRISGMSSLVVNKKDTNCNIKVYWSDSTSFIESRSIVFDQSSPLQVETTFDGFKPNYFKLLAIGAAASSIESMTLTFSCMPEYPTVLAESTDIERGYTTGSGIYQVGVNVTVDATANSGFLFKGWYDENDILISSTPSYTFIMPSYDVTYYAHFKIDLGPLIKGDNIEFGSYPQSNVTDTTIISELNSLAGTLPTPTNSYAWTDYNYYINSQITSYMWYIDLPLGDDIYRGVYFTSYRLYNTSVSQSAGSSYQDDNGYFINNTYWFKFDPIQWKIRDLSADKAFLVSNLILDCQDFNPFTVARNINGNTVYANNYEYSSIRTWLNSKFYNVSFDSEQKSRILTTLVDNSLPTTGYPSLPYVCNNTCDKVFLLSYSEASSSNYLFSTNADRVFVSTEYSQSQNLYVYLSSNKECGRWFLRSPAENPQTNANYLVRSTHNGGIFTPNMWSIETYRGVVPAIWIER